MNELTLDELIEKLSEIRELAGHGNIAVFADVNGGEYEVSFSGARWIPDRRIVMLWDSDYSDYSPRIYDAS